MAKRGSSGKVKPKTVKKPGDQRTKSRTRKQGTGQKQQAGSRSRAGSRKGARGTKRSPRSQVLPGMEQVRDKVLDNLAEGISDERTAKNAADQEEKSLIASALKRMVDRGISVYRHGGVELARVPGAEKLRVRLTKEQGDADAADLEVPDAEENEIRGDEVEGRAEDSDAEIRGEIH